MSSSLLNNIFAKLKLQEKVNPRKISTLDGFIFAGDVEMAQISAEVAFNAWMSSYLSSCAVREE